MINLKQESIVPLSYFITIRNAPNMDITVVFCSSCDRIVTFPVRSDGIYKSNARTFFRNHIVYGETSIGISKWCCDNPYPLYMFDSKFERPRYSKDHKYRKIPWRLIPPIKIKNIEEISIWEPVLDVT